MTAHGTTADAPQAPQDAILCEAMNPFNQRHRCTLGLGHPVEVAHTDGDATWLDNPSPEALAAAERFRASQGANPLAVPGCTCPWNNGYRIGLGHHIDCPTLHGEHSPKDGCGPNGHRDGRLAVNTATDILRVRAAIRRRVSNDPDTLAMAGEIEALADLLDAIREWEATKGGLIGGLGILVRRDALERAITENEPATQDEDRRA